MRCRQIAQLSNPDPAENEGNVTEGDNSPTLRNEESTNRDERSVEQGSPSPSGTFQDADTAKDRDENATL